MSYKPGDILAGKYKILSELGGGAMGKLYKAENLSLHKHVAIKIMQGSFASQEEYQLRFMREATAAASLDHFNICTMLDYDVTEDGSAYIVMELLSGETLAERIHRVGALHPLSACIIMRQLLNALTCAHHKGIVHRDVKPDNVFLVPHDGRDDFVKLIDFGVAHIEHPDSEQGVSLTQSGQVYGTPQYISPEQANGLPVDYRADLYAAGVIFYEMLVGTPPFQGKSCLELLIKQVNEPAPHIPDTIVQSFRLDTIVQRLLEKKPENRFQSGAEVTALLDEVIMLLTSTSNQLKPSDIAALSGTLTGAQCVEAAQNAASRDPNQTLTEYRPVNLRPTEPAPAKRGIQKKYWIITIALSVAVVAFIVYELVRKDPSPQIVTVTGDAPAKSDGAKPAPYNVENEYFGIATDPVLAADTKLVYASEAYLHQKYDDAYKALMDVREKYWEHPNFLRLFLLSANAAGEQEMQAHALAHLMAVEPNAARNPSVSKLAISLFADADNSAALADTIVKEQGSASKTAMAWLIIRTDYDVEELILMQMFDAYDRLNNSIGTENETPDWMIRAVNVWRLSKKECGRRLQMLSQLEGMAKNRDEVYENVILPFHRHQGKSCFVSRKSADCNACLRSWLDEVVSNHDNGIEGKPSLPAVSPDDDEIDETGEGADDTAAAEAPAPSDTAAAEAPAPSDTAAKPEVRTIPMDPGLL